MNSNKSVKFDEKGFPIVPQKFKECEAQVRKNDMKKFKIKGEINAFYLPPININPIVYAFLKKQGFDYITEKADFERAIREKEQELHAIENNSAVRSRCQELNYNNYENACPNCKSLPDKAEKVKSYKP